jgi:hypothetical protein
MAGGSGETELFASTSFSLRPGNKGALKGIINFGISCANYTRLRVFLCVFFFSFCLLCILYCLFD